MTNHDIERFEGEGGAVHYPSPFREHDVVSVYFTKPITCVSRMTGRLRFDIPGDSSNRVTHIWIDPDDPDTVVTRCE